MVLFGNKILFANNVSRSLCLRVVCK